MSFNGKPYYIGLDGGTNSVGWAVTDTAYNLLRHKGQDMWGSHLFGEAVSAARRKYYRNIRRSLDRKKERIALLQDVFADEISAIDFTFFLRLNESGLRVEDRSEVNKQKFSLFCDKDYSDKEYRKLFPTAFHLRMALIDGTAPHDPRLVYLALHHILMHRGHFMFEGRDLNGCGQLKDLLEVFNEAYEELFGEELHYSMSYKGIEDVFNDDHMTSKEKIDVLSSAISVKKTTKIRNAVLKAMFGFKVKIQVIFEDVSTEITDLEFRKSSFDTADIPLLENDLADEQFRLVEILKQIFDWSLLSNIMCKSSRGFYSEAKVAQYDENRRDLATLKNLVSSYMPEEYMNFFYGSDAGKGLYSNYIGSVNTCPKKGPDGKIIVSRNVPRASTDDFYKRVKSMLEKMPNDDPDVNDFLRKIEADDFMVLLRSYRNGAVPYQVHKKEMVAILESASSYMPWLNVQDEDGLTPAEKIISLLEFRVPYYVGPLSDPEYNPHAWIIRRKEGRILPWNFDDLVDKTACDERFVRRRTNKCSYILGEDVLPRNSILYQTFDVLNQLNTVKIDGVSITVEQKQKMFKALYMESRKDATKDVIKEYAISEGWIPADSTAEITGFRGKTCGKYSTYHLFKDFNLNDAEKEWIINALSIHADGGKIINEEIRAVFGDRLSETEIRTICRMRFKGWGRLSEKFLVGIKSNPDENGEEHNIINLLWSTNENLMQILFNRKYGFEEKILGKECIEKLVYEEVVQRKIPPKVMRQIWQSIKVLKEIIDIMGYPPSRVFLEFVKYRVPEKKGTKLKTRKDILLKVFNDHKELIKSYPEVYGNLKEIDNELLKKDNIYLYFTQLGRCMYTGKILDFEELVSRSGFNCDTDHIYPYSKSGDNSLNNRVVVYSNANRCKDERFPIAVDVRNKMDHFWKMLHSKGFISDEKYTRLVRSTPLTEKDFDGFVNRQLGDTGYGAKYLARILRNYFGKEVEIVCTRSMDVSDFRYKFKLYKSRSINSLHHAKDAYLDIVVGNIMYTKYTSKWFLKNVDFYNPFDKRVFDAWIPHETIYKVRRILDKNSIFYTKQPEKRTGQMFDVNPIGKDSGMDLLPIKMSNPRLKELLEGAEDRNQVIREWTEKYGGYTCHVSSHFALIRRMDRIGRVYHLIPIKLLRAHELIDPEALRRYCTEELHYVDVEVIRPIVHFNTTLIVDGFRFTLIGGTNERLYLESAVPLILSNAETGYIVQLEKFSKYRKSHTGAKVIAGKSWITLEKNIELYHVLQDKSHNHCFASRPANQAATFDKGVERFIALSIEDQVDVLLQMIAYFNMLDGKADLRALGASAYAGSLKLPAKIGRNYKSFVLVDCSVTGLYEHKTVLA